MCEVSLHSDKRFGSLLALGDGVTTDMLLVTPPPCLPGE